jgi:hypothetical protein
MRLRLRSYEYTVVGNTWEGNMSVFPDRTEIALAWRRVKRVKPLGKSNTNLLKKLNLK